MDSSHLHPRARRLDFLFKLGSPSQDQAFFSKLASKAKMLSPSHPRAEIPVCNGLSIKAIIFQHCIHS